MSIAVCLATYNGSEYLSEQLDSLLSQTYINWKLFIHDDNSHDLTVALIKQYANQYKEKIIYIDDEISFNNASANFSYIVESIEEEFEFYMFCDQDDIWLPDKIESTLQKMHETEKSSLFDLPVLVHTDLIVVDELKNIVANSMWTFQKIDYKRVSVESLIGQPVVTGCTVMFNTPVKRRFFPIPKEAIMHDWWLSINVAKFGLIGYLEKPTILYRQHKKNAVGVKKVTTLYYFKRIMNISNVLISFKHRLNMVKQLDFSVNIFAVVFLKLYGILSELVVRK